MCVFLDTVGDDDRFNFCHAPRKPHPAKMNAVYLVIENGTPYPVAYATFDSALSVVKEKFREEIIEALKQGVHACTDTDAVENTKTGITSFYVEKGIQTYIYKLPILSF